MVESMDNGCEIMQVDCYQNHLKYCLLTKQDSSMHQELQNHRSGTSQLI